MPYGERTLEIDFDFIDHELVIRDSDAHVRRLPLSPRPVCDFYAQLFAELAGIGVELRINAAPQECPVTTHFHDDREHASYDRALLFFLLHEQPEATRRRCSEHVVESDQVGLDHVLPASQRLAFALQDEGTRRRWRMPQAFGVGVALGRRRAAKDTDHLREGCVRQLLQGRAGWRGDGAKVWQHHHPRVVVTLHADRLEHAIQAHRLAERRDAHHQGQRGCGIDRLAQRQLVGHRHSPWRHGIDAARALGLSRRQAHQPAVEPALLRRRAGVEPRVFDPRQEIGIETARDDRVHAHGGHRMASMRRTISAANSTKACAPREAGSNTTPGSP